MAAQKPEPPLILVSLYPILNYLRFHRRISLIRTDLRTIGITLHLLPILFLTRYFYIPRLLVPIYLFQARIVSIWISRRLRPTLIHCRSYPAAIVGLMVKFMSGGRVIFDTRAFYPEEAATREDGGKSTLLNRASFDRWKKIERSLICKADAIAVVSRFSMDILASQYPKAKNRIFVAPTCTRVASQENIAIWRQQTRQKLGLLNHRVVAYVGSWFNPRPTIELFRLFIEWMPDIQWHFLLLLSARARIGSTSSNKRIQRMLNHELGSKNNCTVITAPQDEVVVYLAGADLGAEPVGVSKRWEEDKRYQMLAQSMLSVKCAEYLACGLPVMISRWHGAAATIVRENDLGIVYDEMSPEDILRWLARWQNQRMDFQVRAWQFAKENLSMEVVAQRYLDLYDRLLD